VLCTYFDTGNEINPRAYEIVTLAGYSAKDEDWHRIQARWQTAVSRAWATCDMPEDMTPYLHTTDLITKNKPFTRARGWNKSKEESLLSECVEIIAEESRTDKFRGVSSSVLLDDYAKVRRDERKGIRTPPIEDICSSFCAGYALAWSLDFAESYFKDGASLYFDQNEPFRGSIVNRRRHKRLRNTGVWQKLVHVGEVNMKVVPAVQMADLLAWSINARYEGSIRGDWQRRLLNVPRESQWLDELALRSPRVDHLETLLALKLPNRRFRDE